MSVEGKLILRRQAVGIKYCGGSFTHRVLGAPIPQRVARRLEHAGTQANPSRLGRIGSQRGINTMQVGAHWLPTGFLQKLETGGLEPPGGQLHLPL